MLMPLDSSTKLIKPVALVPLMVATTPQIIDVSRLEPSPIKIATSPEKSVPKRHKSKKKKKKGVKDSEPVSLYQEFEEEEIKASPEPVIPLKNVKGGNNYQEMEEDEDLGEVNPFT